jgi:hypothetical protein
MEYASRTMSGEMAGVIIDAFIKLSCKNIRCYLDEYMADASGKYSWQIRCGFP